MTQDLQTSLPVTLMGNQSVLSSMKQDHAFVVWLTGVSGAGKSTLSNLLKEQLDAQGLRSFLLDGDQLREGLNQDLGFSDADRHENIRRTAEVARLMVNAGLVVIVALISPFQEARPGARALRPGSFSKSLSTLSWMSRKRATQRGCMRWQGKGPFGSSPASNRPMKNRYRPTCMCARVKQARWNACTQSFRNCH